MPHCYTSSPLKNAHFYWTYISTCSLQVCQKIKSNIANATLQKSFYLFLACYLSWNSIQTVFSYFRICFWQQISTIMYILSWHWGKLMLCKSWSFILKNISQFQTSKLRLFCFSAAVFATQISSHDLIATLAWKLHFSFQTPNPWS